VSGSLVSGGAFAEPDQKTRNVGRTTERELNIVISASFCSMTICKGEQEKVVVVESASESDDARVNLDYAIRNRVGYLEITLGDENDHSEGKAGVGFSDFKRGKWKLKITDAIPISLDVELGVGSGRFDLGGLQVKDFNLSTGASDVSLSFDEVNSASVEDINIECGVGSFTASNLGNAKFKRLQFQGGVGSCILDFTGDLDTEVDVDAEVSLGMLTIIVPEDVGARVLYDKNLISHIDLDRDFSSSGEDEYVTDNYESTQARMNIQIRSGLGNITVRRP
ncbi:MAG: hypothetical protein KAJ12_01065, partial [Bacteroidetes bacterium]|nr:hypothetical protein [Bacteroidota bacterium]